MPETDKKSNGKRGGRRPGAGRKPSTIRGIMKKLPKDAAALILVEIKANQKWVQLADSQDESIVLGVLKYLTDRAYGKPKQEIEASGPDGRPISVETRNPEEMTIGQIDARLAELRAKRNAAC